MSTRATIHFVDSKGEKPTAIIYRHGDGYPDGLGKDLQQFFKDVNEQCTGGWGGTRFSDAAYLSAKWVVWDANQMAKYAGNKEPKLLDFLSVGILNRDPDDIEYRYTVHCYKQDKNGFPVVTVKKV